MLVDRMLNPPYINNLQCIHIMHLNIDMDQLPFSLNTLIMPTILELLVDRSRSLRVKRRYVILNVWTG